MPKPQDMTDALSHPEVHYSGEVTQVHSKSNFAKHSSSALWLTVMFIGRQRGRDGRKEGGEVQKVRRKQERKLFFQRWGEKKIQLISHAPNEHRGGEFQRPRSKELHRSLLSHRRSPTNRSPGLRKVLSLAQFIYLFIY